MAAVTKSLYPQNDTDANFRLWGKAISDQMAAGGWVKTTDTGQVDWTTVTKPTSTGQMVGYEIWRSNDASSGINEIYVKLEYGGNAFGAGSAGMYVTVGFASNGSGSLTGITSTRQYTYGWNAQSNYYDCNLAVGTGWISIAMFTGYYSTCWYIGVERTVNNDLSTRNEVLFLFCGSAGPGNTSVPGIISQVINKDENNAYPAVGALYGRALINPTYDVQGSKVGFSIISGQRGGLTNPSKNAFGSVVDALGAVGNKVVINTYGVNRTYIINAANPYFSNTTGGQIIVSRFE